MSITLNKSFIFFEKYIYTCIIFIIFYIITDLRFITYIIKLLLLIVNNVKNIED